MSRQLYIDVSPPRYTGPSDVLDKGAFKKTFNILGARVQQEKTRLLLKATELKRHVHSLVLYEEKLS